jgi:hypothetical protein
MQWLEPKGEILLIQRPSATLDVSVILDKSEYAPGDPVNYQIQVLDSKTRKLVTDREVIVSLTATDDSVFAKVEARKQPPSLGAAVYLENEVAKNNYELYYANQYIDHWFSGGANGTSADQNIGLLLASQGWRANAFDLRRVYDVYYNNYNMDESLKVAYQQLYGTTYYQHQYYNEMVPMADGGAPAPMPMEPAVVDKNRA